MIDSTPAPDAAPPAIRGTMVGRLVGGSAVSLLGFAVSVVQAILQVPLLLAVWPSEVFAAWVTALAMHSLLTSCDIGLHNFIGVEVNLIGLGRRADIRRLFGAALRIWTALSLVQLIALAILRRLPGLADTIDPATARLLQDAGGAVGILVGQWIVIGSVHGACSRVLLAGGQTVLFQWLGIIHRSLLFAATILAAYAGCGPTGVAVAYAGVATLSGAVTLGYVIRKYPGIVPGWADGSWASGWSLFCRSSGLTVSSLLEQSTVGGLTTVVAGVFQDLQVAAFSTMRTLANFVTQAATVVMNPTVPEFGRSVSSGAVHHAAVMIELAYILGASALAIVTTFASPWIPGLYHVWTRHELPFDTTLGIALIMAVLVRQVGVPLHYFLFGTNQVRAQFTASCIRAAALYGSLPAAIIWLGVAGAGVSLVIAEGCCVTYFAAVTARSFRELGGSLEPQSGRLALAQVAVAVTCLSAVLVVKANAAVCVGCGLLAHGVLLGFQVYRLPASVTGRIARAFWFGRGASRAGVDRA